MINGQVGYFKYIALIEGDDFDKHINNGETKEAIILRIDVNF